MCLWLKECTNPHLLENRQITMRSDQEKLIVSQTTNHDLSRG